MKKQKRYKICRGLFFLVFLLANGTLLAFRGMAAEKESAATQTGAAGACIMSGFMRCKTVEENM